MRQYSIVFIVAFLLFPSLCSALIIYSGTEFCFDNGNCYVFGNDVRFDMVTVYGTNITFYDPRDMDDNKLYYVLDDEGRVIKEFVDTCTLDQPDSNTTIYFRRSIDGVGGGGYVIEVPEITEKPTAPEKPEKEIPITYIIIGIIIFSIALYVWKSK